jgi:hypothetical protein
MLEEFEYTKHCHNFKFPEKIKTKIDTKKYEQTQMPKNEPPEG